MHKVRATEEQGWLYFFESREDILEYLEISQPTFYRRAKVLGIDTKKLEFTESEVDSLREKPKVDPTKKVDSETESESTKQLITILQNQLNEKDNQIKQLNSRLEESNTNLSQQQKLQADLQNKLNQSENLVLELKESSAKKKGFFSRLFGSES